MMKRSCFLYIAIILITLVCPFETYGQETNLSDFSSEWAKWSISGQNSLHIDYYDSTGPNGAYFNEGIRSYNDLNIQFQNTSDPFNPMKGYFSGTINDSPYRSDRYGITVERFNFNQENGKAAVPYRFDVGDFYAFITPRTLQRSLKGGQIELQPGTLLGADNSLLLQYGYVAQDYREKMTNNSHGGASWMLNWKNTRFAVHSVYSRQESQNEIPALSQYLWGTALSHKHALFKQNISIDAEWSRTRSEEYRNAAVATGDGNGYFLQLQGRSSAQVLPINYTFRFEEYDREYLAPGSNVQKGRRIFDNRIGWQSDLGFTVTGRAQFYKDGMGTDSVTDTEVYGLSATGSVPNPWKAVINASLDAYRQDMKAPNIKKITDSLTANLNTPLPWGWTAQAFTSIQDLRTKEGTAPDSNTSQVGLSLGHALSLFGFQGTANGGITYYTTRESGNDSNNLGFNFSSHLSKDALRLGLNYRYVKQNTAASDSVMFTHAVTGSIDYTYGKHVFRLEADHGIHQRNQDTRDTRVSFTWTFNFAKEARVGRPPVTAPFIEEKKITEEAPLKITTLGDLTPGLPIEKVLAALSAKGIKGGIEVGNNIVFETVWYPEITQRQRLVLTKRVDRLEKATLIIDLTKVGEPETLAQLYERLQTILVRSFGSPVTNEKGEFGPNLINDLSRGLFIRTCDWSTPTGTLRLGIPYRGDGTVRIEIQHAESFPFAGHIPWGLEEIR